MSHTAAPSGLDDRPPALIAPRRPQPSVRKNAHRGLAACRRAASGKSRSQARAASGKTPRLPTTARRSHLLPQSKPKQPNSACIRFGLDCPNQKSQPKLCFGTFSFGGLEGDLGEGSFFAGSILESTVSGLDVGSLYEGAVGGEGGVAGLAITQSSTTGNTGGFAFGGGGASAGPLAGVQVGAIVSSQEFGFYYESHRGPFAGGGGFAFSSCGGKSQ